MSEQVRDCPRPKVDLVLRYAREEAVLQGQEARLEAFRGRAGGLLAFAAVFAALSVAAAAGRGGGGVLIFAGSVCIVVAACFPGAPAGCRLARNPEPQALAREYLHMDVEDRSPPPRHAVARGPPPQYDPRLSAPELRWYDLLPNPGQVTQHISGSFCDNESLTLWRSWAEHVRLPLVLEVRREPLVDREDLVHHAQ